MSSSSPTIEQVDSVAAPRGGAVPDDRLPLEPDGGDVVEGLSGQPLKSAMALATLSWVFGAVWITLISGAPVALFAQHLGASKFEFGLLSALPFVASLASMPASVLTDRTGARKKIFLAGLYAQRMLWFPIALVPLYIVATYGLSASNAAMAVFLLLVFVMHVGGAVGGPAWTSWMADIVPARVRGKYFSRRRQWGILSAIPTALVAGWFLDRLSHGGGDVNAGADPLLIPRWCAILFMCGAIFGLADIHLFQYVPEVKMKPQKRVPLLQYFTRPLKDREFLWFGGFVATLVFAVSFMGQFVTLFLIEKVKINNTGIQLMLLVAPMLAQLIVLPLWGKAVDRMGKKPVMTIASLGLVPVGLGWCLMNMPGSVWLGYALSVLGAVFWTGVEVANLNLVLEFSSSHDKDTPDGGGGSSYVAVNSVIINVAGCFGGLASGLIAQNLGGWYWESGFAWLGQVTFYEILFALSGLLRLAAVVVFLPHIHEHDAGTTHDVLRFMSANIYNNLFNAVLLPVRTLKLKLADDDPLARVGVIPPGPGNSV